MASDTGVRHGYDKALGELLAVAREREAAGEDASGLLGAYDLVRGRQAEALRQSGGQTDE